MSLVRITPPALEPLTLAEVVAHLRLTESNLEPAPDAPLVALAGVGAGNVNNGAHRYRLTFLTAEGETNGGQVSDAVTVIDHTANGKVLVVLPIGGALVTERRLFRTVAGGEEYLLVATISDNTTTEYTDNVADASLGVGVPVANATGDGVILGFIQTARETVEDSPYCLALLTQTYRFSIDHFPRWGRDDTIVLPIAPVQSIDSFQYVDASGNIVDFTDYTLDADAYPPRIVLAPLTQWPETRQQRNAVTVTLTAGFGDARADVPTRIKSAMKLIIGHMNENREAVIVDARAVAVEIPMGAEALLQKWYRPAMAMA